VLGDSAFAHMVEISYIKNVITLIKSWELDQARPVQPNSEINLHLSSITYS
jgi:hypothetical protein